MLKYLHQKFCLQTVLLSLTEAKTKDRIAREVRCVPSQTIPAVLTKCGSNTFSCELAASIVRKTALVCK